jgi:hypothetical protein
MGKPYSQDLRERVIAAVDTGTGAYVAALLFQVSVSYILQGFDPAAEDRRSDRAPVRLRSETKAGAARRRQPCAGTSALLLQGREADQRPHEGR